ncbi:MAG: putative metal-binding motif-containing protein, partial [Candidatus Woesearchaeota archaeon]|nr:putative metal-binding motif-containing protein [Candidatus Woesearchaeota archaeon]
MDSASGSLLAVYGSYNNVTGNHFDHVSEGYYALSIMNNALSNNIWLNNFYDRGALNNGTGTSFCMNVPSHLQNDVYSSSSLTRSVGNYYAATINSSHALKGSCGNLPEAFDDSDYDNYYSIIDDCDDTNVYAYPGATEYCDDFDNNCDGQIDEGVCNVKFPSAGTNKGGSSGGGGGGGGSGYSVEGKKTAQNIIDNPVVTLYRGDTVSFVVKGIEESVKLNKIYFDKVNVSMPLLSKGMIFNLNESMMFDIDKDGLNDLEILLSSIEGSSAIFYIKETTIEVKPEITKTPEEMLKEGEQSIKEEKAAENPAQEKSSLSSAGKKVFDFMKNSF